jgi:hypothetical protein
MPSTKGKTDTAKAAERTLAALPGKLFNVVSRGWVIGKLQHSSKAVEAIAYSDVYTLAKDPITPVCIGNDLCVPSTYVKDHGIIHLTDDSAHLDVACAHICANLSIFTRRSLGCVSLGWLGKNLSPKTLAERCSNDDYQRYDMSN